MGLKKATSSEAGVLCINDPVRPDLPLNWRVAHDRNVYYLESNYFNNRTNKVVDAVLCVAHLEGIPINEDELMAMSSGPFVCFYSVWSNRRGAGREILFDVLDLKKSDSKRKNRYITMSPKTEMAKKFHLSNGAILIQENLETYNFEYE